MVIWIAQVIEVKCKPLESKDVKRFREKAAGLPGKKIFVCTEKPRQEYPDVTVLDPIDLASLVRQTGQ